jgi:predicted nucleotidyltransferase
MDLDELVQEKRQDILRVAAQRGARNVRLFGSVARGESTTDSDIDFLVELDPDRSLFDLAHLILDLEDLLDCKVDVVTEDSIYWLLRRRILREARPL